MNTNLEVRIESEGGALTLTPMGLLEHFLPGAKLMPGSTRVFEGHVPGQAERKVYVQAEALYGMLMEAREKHLNPISSMYLIPSTHPDRPAGHKIKYDVGVQRARRIPGFLGMNMGLLVKRGNTIAETSGEVSLDGDQVLGAWAEIYISGMPRPLRKEISKREFAGASKVWSEKGGFMLCKVALDHLLRTNYPTLYADVEDAPEGEVTLASSPAPESALETTPEADSHPQQPEFAAGTLYVGTLASLTPRLPADKEHRHARPGQIVLQTEQGELLCYFWQRPQALKKEELDWESFIGQPAALSFTEKPDRTGTVYRYVDRFELATAADVAGPQADPEEEGV